MGEVALEHLASRHSWSDRVQMVEVASKLEQALDAIRHRASVASLIRRMRRKSGRGTTEAYPIRRGR